MSIFGPIRKSFFNDFFASLCLCGIFFLSALAVFAQVPSPKDVLGFHPTDDKVMADWSQIVDYFNKLDKASPKVLVKEIGKTTLGKPLIVAFISSPSNIANLEKYRQINAKLADPRTIKTDAEANGLIASGKTIVSISCSIHSTELVAAQESMNFAYDLATATDPQTKEILDNDILLLVPSSNPDGVTIVADWYKKTLGTRAEGSSPPELYHYYAGHDDNRDWFMMNLKETQAITKLFWKEWFPQIVYDVHQQGSNASRFIIPPFFDPNNPRVSPVILREVGLIGYKMAADLQSKGFKGIATNSTYDTWWHGGFRSAPYFHNSIGILSEAASTNLMTPTTISLDDLKRNRGVRGLSNLTEPATNYPDPWLGGTWHASDIAAIESTAMRSLLEMAAKFRPHYLRNFYELGKANLAPNTIDPAAFIVTAGQPNAENVSRLLEILMWQGIEVYEMKQELLMTQTKGSNDFHEMPAGSFIVFTDQPQRNNVLSLFEKQVYPDRRLPNGDAEAPYDVAGWTLPLQMGVTSMPAWNIRDLDRSKLKAITNINDIRSNLNLDPAKEPFAKIADPLKTNPKVALYKGFNASMDEGWTRFVFDSFSIPYKSLSPADVRAGRLDYDTIVFASDSENAIVNGGFGQDRLPEEYRGGIGDEGVNNLKKFVENGGKIVCFDDSCELMIKSFGLPIRNVLAGLRRNEFYNPGSIVQLKVDTRLPLAKGLAEDTPAYFITSAAYDIALDASNVRVVARYADRDALLSGWMVGEKYLNGKVALAEANVGKGKIVLFAFRPQHRGQSWATFPFIFNALEKE